MTTETMNVPDVFDSLLYARASANTSDVEAGYASLLRRLSAHDMRMIRDALRANNQPPREGTQSLVDPAKRMCDMRCPTEVRPCPCFPFADDCWKPAPEKKS